MSHKNLHKWVEIIVFSIILGLFCYFRLKSIFFQTVGFTYDQGRDFLKAARIILELKPALSGPTTGIVGLNHGVWWYYLLTIPFLLFQGLPIGFYYFNFFIQLASFVIFYWFVRKYFGILTALITSTLIATSYYFTFTAIFVGNNVMALPMFLGLLMSTYFILEEQFTQKTRWLFLTVGLTLGFVAEFELAFGIFLIPTYIVLMLVFKKYRTQLLSKKHYVYLLAGLIFAFLPRIAYELAKKFIQTQVFLNFFLHPKLHTPKPYSEIFHDRVMLFYDYYKSMFMIEPIMLLVTAFVIVFVISAIIYNRKHFTTAFFFFLSLGTALFFLSTLYKDTFWSYYYDGIHYLFLLLIAFAFSFAYTKLNTLLSWSKTILLAIVLICGTQIMISEASKPIPYDGIRVQQDVVNYILSNEKDTKNFCVRVYTPPVIPHTYNYLFLYNNVAKKTAVPSVEWTNKHCWFIVEKDDFKERKQKWRDENEPKQGKKVSTKIIKDVEIEQWIVD